MEDRSKALWQGARPLIGTVVGVGIFGLPYVFSQAGFGLGLLGLVLVAALSLISLCIFSDLLAVNKGHVRFVAVIGNQLGPVGRAVAALAFIGSLWGALLAYLIVGGEFVYTVLHPLIGGSLFQYQTVFWVVASACMIGGTLFVRRLQAVLIPLVFMMVVALALFALPQLHVEYLTTWQPEKSLLPLGALIFAFTGFASVPEAREALGRRKTLMRPALVLAIGLIAVLYILFTVAILGLTGPFTSPQAVESLRLVAGPWLATFVSLLGLCTVFTAYISAGNALLNSLLNDFRGRFLSSWWLVVAIPLCLFLAGARDFIGVIGATGGLLGGLCGVVLVLAYEKARLSEKLPKRQLALPQLLVGLCFVLFVAMIVLTLIELI